MKPRFINSFIKTSQQQHRLHVSMVRDHQRHEQLTNSWIEPPSDSCTNICSADLQLEVFQYLNVADVVRHVSKSRKKLITFLNWSVDKSRCLEGSFIMYVDTLNDSYKFTHRNQYFHPEGDDVIYVLHSASKEI